MATQQLETMAGQVSEVQWYDSRPIKVNLAGRGWVNLSKPEYRKAPWEDPNEGDSVKLGVSRGKNGEWYAATCEIQHRGNPASFNDGQVSGSGKDLSIARSVALKAATEIITAWTGRLSAEVVFDSPMVSRNVLALAKDFESWLVRTHIDFE